MIRSIAFCLLVVAASTSSAMSLNYVSEGRYVEVAATLETPSGPQNPSMQVSANGFGPFDETLNQTFMGDGGAEASGSASQTSELLDAEMTAMGSGSGTTGPPAGSSEGSGESFFQVSFDVSQAVPYQLDLEMISEFGGYSFTGPGLNLVQPFGLLGFNPINLDESGMLAPGSYDFEIQIQGTGASQGMDSTFDFAFAVPEPNLLPVGWLLVVGSLGWVRTRARG